MKNPFKFSYRPKFKVIETAPVGIPSKDADMKPALLENGVRLNVPEFIRVGDIILVNTEKGIFHSRLK